MTSIYHVRDYHGNTNVMQAPRLITDVNTIANRTKERREALGMTQGQLAKLAGVSQGTIANIENGIRKQPRELLSIAKALQVHPEWLQSGKETNPQKQAAVEHGNVDAARHYAGEVPVISWIQAGAWHEAADSFQPGDADRFLPVMRGHSTNTYALRVRGDSMTASHGRTYPEGCYIIVDPHRLAPVNGERIVAKLEGSDEVTFKVFKNEDGRQWLAPLNTQHPPILAPFKILGTVIGKWEDE